MSWRRIVPAIVLFLAATSPLARAEPLLQTLPEDGEWVQFHVNLKVSEQSTTPEWTVKSVGKKVIADVAYRWIELESKEAEHSVVIFKCLVAENEFGNGKNPLAHALQVFVKYADQEPREVETLVAADPALALILSGPAEAQKLDAKEAVELQSGRIECDVVTGIAKSEFGTAKFQMDFRLLMSDKVPHGLAGAKIKIEAEFGGSKLMGSAELSLKEHGKNAKTALPAIE